MQRIANEHSERMASAELQLGLALPKLQPAIEDVATMLTEMRKSKDRLKELEARMAESSDRVDKWQRRGASEGALVLQRIDAVQVAARLVCLHRHAASSHTCWHGQTEVSNLAHRSRADASALGMRQRTTLRAPKSFLRAVNAYSTMRLLWVWIGRTSCGQLTASERAPPLVQLRRSSRKRAPRWTAFLPSFRRAWTLQPPPLMTRAA